MTQYGLTTSVGGTLAKLGRKVQGNVLVGFNKKCEEWAMARGLKNFDLDFSAREVTTPIDIVRQGSGQHIPEFGYEAVPRTVAPQELTFTWANYNDRYTYSLTSVYLDRRSRNAELIRQAKFQTKKLIEGCTNRVGFGFYGQSSGILAQITNAVTNATGAYTVTNGFGQTDITDGAYLASLFQPSFDYVALHRNGTLVSNALGGTISTMTTASSVLTMTVIWPGSVTSVSGDTLVFANSAGHLLITGTIAHTEYNLCPVGLIEASAATSVHGLSGATYPLHNAAYSDTSGGALTGTKIIRGNDALGNVGGVDGTLLIWDQGVRRRLFQDTSSAVEYSSTDNMNILGKVKTGGIAQFDSRKVPPGRAWLVNKDRAFRKWSMVDMPSEDADSLSGENFNTDKLQDQNGMVDSFDLPYAWVWPLRAGIAYWTGLSTA